MTPAGTSNELDVQNGWEENTHTNTHTLSKADEKSQDISRKTLAFFFYLLIKISGRATIGTPIAALHANLYVFFFFFLSLCEFHFFCFFLSQMCVPRIQCFLPLCVFHFFTVFCPGEPRRAQVCGPREARLDPFFALRVFRGVSRSSVSEKSRRTSRIPIGPVENPNRTGLNRTEPKTDINRQKRSRTGPNQMKQNRCESQPNELQPPNETGTNQPRNIRTRLNRTNGTDGTDSPHQRWVIE